MKFRLALTGACLAILASTAFGQGMFGNLTPQQQAQLQAKQKAWQRWRDNHKNVNSLQQTMMGFQVLEKDPKTALTPAQAKVVVPILKAWRKKPVITDDQARAVNKQLGGVLTDKQLKAIASAPRPGQGGRGFGGGARMGGGAAGGASGRAPAFDISKFPDPTDYNPLNPDSLPFAGMRGRIAGRMDAFIKSLADRAR